jgi:hypothetical protein
METLTVSKAKAGFSKVTRKVIKSRQSVLVRTPAGFVQISPYDLPEEVPPAPRGSLGKFTKAQLALAESFGETFGDTAR